MPSLNRVVLVGRLTRDPEIRYTTSGLAVCTFTLAVDRRYKTQSGERQTDFIRCKAWRQTAEFLHKYVTKGRLVGVEGSIETSETTGQDGQRKYYTDVVCDNVTTLDSAREGGGNGDAGDGPPDDYWGNQDAQQAAPAPQRQAAPPQREAAPRTAGRPAQTTNRRSVQQPAQPAMAGAGRGPAQPAYPDDDFDDSDPFADE